MDLLLGLLFLWIFRTQDSALGANVALGKLTKQSSIYKHFSEYLTSDKAVDGLTSNVIYCAHTLVDTPTFWWGVDLGMEYSIQKIFIYGTSAAKRRYGYQIFMYKLGEATLNNMPRSTNKLCFNAEESPQLLTLACRTRRKAKIIHIYKTKLSASDALILCEVEVYTDRRGDEQKKLDYCRQNNKDGHLVIDLYTLGSKRRIECANLCSKYENCLGFKVAATGICNLYQTSTASSGVNGTYFEIC